MAHQSVAGPRKAPTGIEGIDRMTGGGLPVGRTTIVAGGTGTGKTMLALQFLANGYCSFGEPGLFVAFEERSDRILANSSTLDWDHARIAEGIGFVDALPDVDVTISGKFDVCGLLAVLKANIATTGARRIVFDGVDMSLRLLQDPVTECREMQRIATWLSEQDVTGLITAKASTEPETDVADPLSKSSLPYIADCVILLEQSLIRKVSYRSLRILKYRGSSFDENAAPLLITESGIVAIDTGRPARTVTATTERVSSGVARLDEMLGGGYFRNSCILLTGAPGTAKTILAGAFAAAASQRNEQTLFVSFDSYTDEIVRDLRAVGLRLGEEVAKGTLQIVSRRSYIGSEETQFALLTESARRHGARCVVIDPLSAITNERNPDTSQRVIERFVHWAKSSGITLLCTSLLDSPDQLSETTPTRLSTFADAWIHLSYVQHAGERNRALSVVKFRGSGHSNQVRELRLANDAISLTDVYTEGGEVLMGTLRWSRERELQLAADQQEEAARLQLRALEADANLLTARMKSIETELLSKQEERETLIRAAEQRRNERDNIKHGLQRLRGNPGT